MLSETVGTWQDCLFYCIDFCFYFILCLEIKPQTVCRQMFSVWISSKLNGCTNSSRNIRMYSGRTEQTRHLLLFFASFAGWWWSIKNQVSSVGGGKTSFAHAHAHTGSENSAVAHTSWFLTRYQTPCYSPSVPLKHTTDTDTHRGRPPFTLGMSTQRKEGFSFFFSTTVHIHRATRAAVFHGAHLPVGGGGPALLFLIGC